MVTTIGAYYHHEFFVKRTINHDKETDLDSFPSVLFTHAINKRNIDYHPSLINDKPIIRPMIPAAEPIAAEGHAFGG